METSGSGVVECELLSVPDNPKRSLVYSAANFLNNKKRAQERVDEWTQNWNPRDEETIRKVVREVTWTMYNAGASGALTVFDVLKRTYRDPMSLQNFQTLFKRALTNCYGEANKAGCFSEGTSGTTSRQREVARYSETIRNELNGAERATGRSCQ